MPSAELLLGQPHVVTMAMARRIGLSARHVERLVKEGRLVRIRPGAFLDTSVFLEASSWERHCHLVAADARRLAPDAAAAHESAAAWYRLPILGKPPSRTTFVREKVAGRGVYRAAGLRVLVTELADTDVRLLRGLRLTVPPRTVFDCGRHLPRDTAVVMLDAALHAPLLSREDLVAELTRHSDWPLVARFRRALALSDGRAESPLESLGRLVFIDHGLPVPLSNVWVGVSGPEFRVDHLWPDPWVIAEGDGRGKYTTSARFVEEKQRQRYMEDLGFTFTRYDWDDATSGKKALGTRVERQLAIAPRGRPPAPYWWDREDWRAAG